MQKKENSLLKKIKALYEKAQSSQELGNVEEANAFMKKVEELILKHNLDLSKIKEFSEVEDIYHNEEREEGIEYYKKETLQEGKWEQDLISIICQYNFCKCFYRTYAHAPGGEMYFSKIGKPPYAVIVGTPSNIEVVKYLVDISRDIFRKLVGPSYDEMVKVIRERLKFTASSKKEALSEFRLFIIQKIEEITLSAMFSSEKRVLLKFYQNIYQKLKNNDWNDYPITENDFMPSSYKEEDKNKSQIYYVKNLSKVGALVDRSTFIRSFLLGVPVGLALQFESRIKEFKQEESDEVVENFNSLILSNKNLLNDYMENQLGYSKMKKTTESVPADKLAFTVGKEKGQNTNINVGLNTGSNQIIVKGLN